MVTTGVVVVSIGDVVSIGLVVSISTGVEVVTTGVSHSTSFLAILLVESQ